MMLAVSLCTFVKVGKRPYLVTPYGEVKIADSAVAIKAASTVTPSV